MEILLTPSLRRRFVFEAEAAAVLEHPHLVRVIEVGEIGLLCYIASQYVPGLTLAQWLRGLKERGQPVALDGAARLVATLAEAMHHAHERGVLHCDLKPGNVLLVDGRDLFPVITDFGLARLIGTPSELSQTGQILGTPAYMAPEQAAGRRKDLTPRSDVWALGAILYELLTGAPPFAADSPVELLHVVLTEDPVPLRTRRRDVPADLEVVCLTCLEKSPEQRYVSAAALADDLVRWLRGESVMARRAGSLGRAARWCRRRPVVAALAAALCLAVAAGVAGMYYEWRRAEAARGTAEANERQATEALHQAEVARREATASEQRANDARRTAEDQVAKLRDLLATVLPAKQVVIHARDWEQEPMLRQAEKSYSALIQQRGGEPALVKPLAAVLARLGAIAYSKGQVAAARAHLELSVTLFERLGPDELRADCQCLFWLAFAHVYLEQVYERQARTDRAEASFAAVFRIWQTLIRQKRTPEEQSSLVWAIISLCAVVAGDRGPEELDRRLAGVEVRLKKLSGQTGSELFVGLVRVVHWQAEAEKWNAVRQPAKVAAANREAAFILRQLLTRPIPGINERIHLAHIALQVGRTLHRRGAPEDALTVYLDVNRVWQRLMQDVPGQYPRLIESWRLVAEADREAAVHQPAKVTAATCETASVLRQLLVQRSSDLNARVALARDAYQVGLNLRHGGAPAVALVLYETVQGTLEEAVRDQPAEVPLLVESWRQIAKARWELKQPNEALAAYRNAIAAQRRAVARAPVAGRDLLARCYADLGRKLCELGRLDEAEATFRERQRLWPGDAARHQETIRELHKWAAEVGGGKESLPPGLRQEKQRYLDLCARLGRRGAAASDRADGERP